MMCVDARVWRGFNSWGRKLRNPPRLLQSNKAVHRRLIARILQRIAAKSV
jgi:hypothetical protein